MGAVTAATAIDIVAPAPRNPPQRGAEVRLQPPEFECVRMHHPVSSPVCVNENSLERKRLETAENNRNGAN